MLYGYENVRLGASAANPDFDLPDQSDDAGSIRLNTLQDILAVTKDAHFEQILAELPAMMRVWRTRTRLGGHIGVQWAVRWRPEGA